VSITQAFRAIAVAHQPDPRFRSFTSRPQRGWECQRPLSQPHELAAILELEHDPDVIELYDQPPPIQLHYRTAKGKAVSALHTPDFFVIGRTSAAWVECKTEEQLLKLASTQPNRRCVDI
jgi:hypothetical protein